MLNALELDVDERGRIDFSLYFNPINNLLVTPVEFSVDQHGHVDSYLKPHDSAIGIQAEQLISYSHRRRLSCN